MSEGCVIYYEGVQTATPESKAFFEKLSHELVGGSDLSGTYKSIDEICGMKFQLDDFGLLDADKAEHPKRHVIADVDAIEIKAEYERLMRVDPTFAKAHANDFQPQPATTDKIFITYGSAHLPGLAAGLRKLDSKWAVGSVKWMRTIEHPDHIEGQLQGIRK